MKLVFEHEQKSKDEDLGRKIRWEKEQFDVYKLRKQFDIDINKEKISFETPENNITSNNHTDGTTENKA